MALFSFSSSPKREATIVVDIGSGSVCAAVVVFDKRKYPHILYSTREEIAHYEHPGFKRFFRAMLNALETATTRLHRETFEKNSLQNIRARDISHIHCVLASPWYNATSKILLYEKKLPFTVTESLIDTIVEQSLITQNTGDPSHQQSSGQKTIEQKTVQILLNGYETDKPYGQKVSRVEVALFTSTVAQEVGSRIQSIVRKTWLNKKISFHSFALASFVVTRDLFPKTNNFILIDVTGEVTDIFFCKNSVLVETSSTPYGKNSLLRDIAGYMHTTHDEALSELRQHGSHNATKDASQKINAALQLAGNTWTNYFETILSHITELEAIPKVVYLMADPDVGEIFSSFVNGESTDKKTPGSLRYEVIYLTSHMLEEHVRFTTAKEHDFFIGMEAVFLNTLFSSHDSSYSE